MIIAFIALVGFGIYAYWLGGQSRENVPFAHTLWRDLGVSACISGIMWMLFGWSWWYLLEFCIAWGGLSLGDDMPGWNDLKAYWTPHAFVISLCMLPYTIINHAWIPYSIMVTIVVGGTFLVSRFLEAHGIDVICRGLLYATMPLWFLIRS